MKQIVLAITGASGAVYARRLGQCLAGEPGVTLHLVATAAGQRLLADELGMRRFSGETLLERSYENVVVHSYRDIGSVLASGSFITHGMVICPCSSNTLAAVACGLGDNLVTRAAMVTLKERRRLILVPRESPLSHIEIGNMLHISEAGGIICPASPGFYMGPQTISDLVDFVVGRVLDLLNLPHALRTRWNPAERSGPNTGDE